MNIRIYSYVYIYQYYSLFVVVDDGWYNKLVNGTIKIRDDILFLLN